MKKTYHAYDDPGHGWLAVPMADLSTLGIMDCISSCSYAHGEIAYLEEDLDAGTFIASARAKGWDLAFKSHYDEFTPIRAYDAYPSSDSWKANLKSRSAAA